MKPDVVASGVEHRDDGAARRTTEAAARTARVNGSSAAAAAVAGRSRGARGGAARAATRPICAASSSASARRLASEPGRRAQGAGLVALGAAAGRRARRRADDARARQRARARAGSARQTSLVRNVSTRPVRVRVRFDAVRAGRGAGRVPRLPVALPAPTAGRRGACASPRPSTRAPIGDRAGRGKHRRRAGRRRSASPAVGGDVRAARRRPCSARCRLSNDGVRAVRRRPGAADVPRGAARRAGRPATRSSRSRCSASTCSTRTATTSARSPRCATCCPAATRSGSPAARPAGNTLGQGRYRIRVTAVPSLPGRASRAEVDVHDQVGGRILASAHP